MCVVANDRLSYLSGGGECIAKPYVQFTHLCSVNNYLPTVDFCCCRVASSSGDDDVTGTGDHVAYESERDWSSAGGALCCRYHQDWNHFRCLDVDDAVRLAEYVPRASTCAAAAWRGVAVARCVPSTTPGPLSS